MRVEEIIQFIGQLITSLGPNAGILVELRADINRFLSQFQQMTPPPEVEIIVSQLNSLPKEIPDKRKFVEAVRTLDTIRNMIHDFGHDGVSELAIQNHFSVVIAEYSKLRQNCYGAECQVPDIDNSTKEWCSDELWKQLNETLRQESTSSSTDNDAGNLLYPTPMGYDTAFIPGHVTDDTHLEFMTDINQGPEQGPELGTEQSDEELLDDDDWGDELVPIIPVNIGNWTKYHELFVLISMGGHELGEERLQFVTYVMQLEVLKNKLDCFF